MSQKGKKILQIQERWNVKESNRTEAITETTVKTEKKP